MGGERGLGGKGSPVWPVCRYIYILPAGGPGEAGAAFLASTHTHNQSAKYLPAVRRHHHHQTPCVSGGREAAANSSGRQLTSGSRLGSCTPRSASLCLDSTCWRRWQLIDRPTYSLAGESANTRASRHGGEAGQPGRNLALGAQTGVPGA